jgi:hypothetical protein
VGFWVSIDLTVELNGRAVLVQLHDHYIQDGDVEDGELQPDELVFNYRVFDIEEDAEITKLSTEDQLTIRKAIIEDLQSICQEED